MKCANCGEENKDGTLFCRKCGVRMDGGGPARHATLWGMVAVGIVIAFLAFWLIRPKATPAPTGPAVSSARTSPTHGGGGGSGDDATVTLGVAYGTEKQDWLEAAARDFERSSAGAGIRVDLKPMGSLEAAHAITRNDKSIHVWSPASSLYEDVFLRDFKATHPAAANPILKEAPLALTPMVFVMWEQRHQAFLKKYPQLTFRTIAEAQAAPGGWDAIAGQPDWMFFKFSHTNPTQSNSGLMAIVLMAYDYHGKVKGIGGAQITDAAFQKWLQDVEKNLVGAASGLVHSTGTLMNAMVQRGWSTYDVIFVYESVALDRLRQADGRWGPLKVVYPKYNLWSENPYYVLDVEWSTPAHRRAAEAFLDYLRSEPVQARAMAHGFRPANVNVSTRGGDSPFEKYAAAGIRADVPGAFCEAPTADVLEGLLLAWQRSQGRP
jgi:hypothetical protein